MSVVCVIELMAMVLQIPAMAALHTLVVLAESPEMEEKLHTLRHRP